MPKFEIELKQTLYWFIEDEDDLGDLESTIEQVTYRLENEDVPDLEQHYTFAANEEREAKILSVDGEKYEM